MMTVRNLLPGERLETLVSTGLEQLPIDQDWCWHAILDDVIVGTLVCCPCHGFVMMFRFVIAESAPPYTARRLLRTMFDDCNSRNYKGYLVLLGPMKEHERKMIGLLRRIGGKQVLEPTVLYYGVNPGASPEVPNA